MSGKNYKQMDKGKFWNALVFYTQTGRSEDAAVLAGISYPTFMKHIRALENEGRIEGFYFKDGAPLIWRSDK